MTLVVNVEYLASCITTSSIDTEQMIQDAREYKALLESGKQSKELYLACANHANKLASFFLHILHS